MPRKPIELPSGSPFGDFVGHFRPGTSVAKPQAIIFRLAALFGSPSPPSIHLGWKDGKARSSRLKYEDVSQTRRHRRMGVSSLHRLRDPLAHSGEAQDIEFRPRTHCCLCGYRTLVLFGLSKTNRARMPYRSWKCRAA